MEAIIKKLLTADNATIESATVELNAALEDNKSLTDLCDLILKRDDYDVRQYAASILQKRLIKTSIYTTLSENDIEYIQAAMWNLLMTETANKLRNAVAGVVGVLVHQEGLRNSSRVRDILHQIMSGITSGEEQTSVNNAKVFALLADRAAESFVPHLANIVDTCIVMFNSNNTHPQLLTIQLYLLTALAHIVPYIVGNTAAEQAYTRLMPEFLHVIQPFARNAVCDEEFSQIFDLFENLAEYTPKVLNYNLRELVDLCMVVGSCKEVTHEKRFKVIIFLGTLAQIKKRAFVKLSLVEPVVLTLFNIMQSPPSEAESVDDFFDVENQTIISVTAQTLDILALHLPVEQFFPPLLRLVEPALQNDNILEKRAAYIIMAVVAEGCSQMICNNYLNTMVAVIKAGIIHPHVLIRNAAFYCLSQYSEYLQPDISKYADQIMPILFEYLHQICNDPRNNIAHNGPELESHEIKQVERMFYALEVFCENLESKQLQPFLQVIMERLLTALSMDKVIYMREMAMHAIAAVVMAAKEEFMPYFNNTLELLRPYFTKTEDEDILELRHHAIDCLSEMALNVGKYNFMPIAKDTMAFAIELLEEADDPDDKCALYGLFSNMAEMFGADMESVFPKIIDTFYTSINSTNEISRIKEDETNPKNCDGDIEIDISTSDDEDDEEDEDIFDVEDAYVREKEDAIAALGSFAKYCGAAFTPYLEISFQTVYTMLHHGVDSVRETALESITNMLIAMFNSSNTNLTMLSNVINKFNRILRGEIKLSVALRVVDSLIDLLKSLKEVMAANEEILNIILNALEDTLNRKLKCQFCETPIETEDSGDDEDSAHEFSLVETAGDLLPAVGNAVGPNRFYPIFERFCPILLDKLNKTKAYQGDEGQTRFFVFGVLAECFQPLSQFTGNYFDLLLPHMLQHIKDKSARVRQNTIYGLGEMVFYAGEKSHTSFPCILTELSEALGNERKASCLDNICGTICRLILTNHALVPLQAVLPVLFQNLPLKEDFAENAVLVKAFQLLFVHQRDTLLIYYEPIVKICLQILAHKQYDNNEETKINTVNLLLELRNFDAVKFNTVAAQNPADAEILKEF